MGVFNKQMVHALFSRVKDGSFTITYWDGTKHHYGDGDSLFNIHLKDPKILQCMADDAELSLGEAYMDGAIDLEGDVSEVIALAIRNHLWDTPETTNGVSKMIRGVIHGGRRSIKQQKADIVHHYDLGNDFFRLWLDDTMTYSCAYFRSPQDTLEQAQRQKMDHTLHKLRLQPGNTLLDIGSGWGELAMQAAETYSVSALGITLSEEQYKASCKAVSERGLEGKASFRSEHYDILANEGVNFDKIVSIGMIEHVGKAHLSEFCQCVKTMLKPGGLALLHLITSPIEGPTGGWVNKYIFPNGYIPTLTELLNHLHAQDFRIWDVENIGPHYRLTLDHWSERFEKCAETVRKMFDERFVRMWRLYLRGASASFREDSLEVHQILVSKGKPVGLPLTREDVYHLA